MMPLKIVDSFGRVHNNLRISVTDRCNIRCFYCMPNENVRFLPQKQILTFEEIERLTRISSGLGVDRIRITGGEPLVRSELEKLIAMIVKIDGIENVALTTNGVLLADQAESLRAAGLNRINISLDTLDEDTFFRLSRRKGLQRVLDGIDAAIEAGFEKVRLNAIAIAGLTDDEVLPLVRFAIKKDLEIRFIEFMPLDAEENWEDDQVLTGEKIKGIVEKEFGQLEPCHRSDQSQPAVDFQLVTGAGRIGFINPISQPFCSTCNRLRLTAEGKIRNCLFSTSEWDAMELIRGGASDEEVANLILDCVANKKASHGIDSEEFSRPAKAMYQIGG